MVSAAKPAAIALPPSFERDVEGSDGLGAALSLELPMFDRNEGEIAQKTAERERRRAELSQESERPEAPLAGRVSVTSATRAPPRARWSAVATPKMPAPITATRMGGLVGRMATGLS